MHRMVRLDFITIVSAPIDRDRAKDVVVDGLLQVHEHLAG